MENNNQLWRALKVARIINVELIMQKRVILIDKTISPTPQIIGNIRSGTNSF